jgi:hypothetical protein
LPLLFSDERSALHIAAKREYFSYIGTIAADHSFNEYINFVEWAIITNKLPNIKFLIATKSEFEIPSTIRSSRRLIVQKGRPMTNEEINYFYAKTILIWNAYARTTQSGVLAKAFMFGTPAIVLHCNLNEFSYDGRNVIAIDNNTNYDEIENAINTVDSNFSSFSNACRTEFEKSFYYRNFKAKFNNLILTAK